MLTYEWRGHFDNWQVEALHAKAFDHEAGAEPDWWERANRLSLGWVCAWHGDELVGFVNVPWDGAAHAFIIDTAVSPRAQRQGVGTRLVSVAVEQARAAGCAWLHVDFEDHLRGYYLDSCGFRPTDAGLIAL